MRAVSDAAVITVTDLHKSYGDVKAVDGITFEVERGEIFGLLGPNGAGKTTTIEILEGLNKPDSGGANVLGIDPTRDGGQLKERIGVQLQTAALYPNLTVTELIGLFGSFYRHARPTNELVSEFALDERAIALTKELSGGQRQRLSVALALVNDPEMIFLDEPTTGLDPQARHSLWSQIRGFAAHGRTTLLTTHYMEEAEELCDRVAIMDHGHILEMGTVTELVARHFKERTVRFISHDELTDARLSTIKGVSHVAHDGEETVLHTSSVPATIGALLEVGEELHADRSRPGRSPADARGRLPAADRPGAARLSMLTR